MLRILLTCLVFSTPLAASAESFDSDGVPVVDIHGKIVVSSDQKALAHAKEWGFQPPSTRMIDVNGKLIPLQEFLLTYCQGKPRNETCSRGITIKRLDSSSGPREMLPKGL